MTEISSKRCYYLDLAKVITTFLVIFGHLYSFDSSVRLYLYAFHMPLFFLISGVFHKYKGKIDWGRYARTILWPVLIFIVLSITVNVLFFGARLGDELRCYSVDFLKGWVDRIVWFLFALFWCKVFMDISCAFRNKIIPVLIWAIMMFVPPLVFNRKLPFLLSQGMMAFPFYAVGYLGKDFLLKRRESVKWGLPFVLCLCLTVLITKYLLGRVSILNITFGDIGKTLFGDAAEGFPSIVRKLFRVANVSLFYLNGLIGSAMILSFCLLPFPRMRVTTALAMSLISVLGTQSIFLKCITYNIGFDNGYLLSIALAICVFFLCYLSHLILKPLYGIVQPKQG